MDPFINSRQLVSYSKCKGCILQRQNVSWSTVQPSDAPIDLRGASACIAFRGTLKGGKGGQSWSVGRTSIVTTRNCVRYVTFTEITELSVAKKTVLQMTLHSQASLQEHFEEDQFALTRKGGLCLKPDALPTIFKHRAPPKRRKGPATRVSLGEPPPGFADHSYCKRHIGTKQEHNILLLQGYSIY